MPYFDSLFYLDLRLYIANLIVPSNLATSGLRTKICPWDYPYTKQER
jgi:hypothetical protein